MVDAPPATQPDSVAAAGTTAPARDEPTGAAPTRRVANGGVAPDGSAPDGALADDGTPTGSAAPGGAAPGGADDAAGASHRSAHGEDHRRTVRPYDFRMPETLDRSQVRGLRVLLEVLAHRGGGVLTTRLRAPVTLVLGDLEQCSWAEYSATLPEPTCLFAVVLPPLTGRLVLHLPVELALVAVDLRMGGPGKATAGGRALTEVEQRLVATVADDLFNELPAIFAPLAALQVGSAVQVSSVQFLPPVRPTDMYLLAPVTLELGEDASYRFDLCFPFSILHPLADALSAQAAEDDLPATRASEAVARRLLDTPVDVRVRFPSTTLTPADVLHLAPGDVIDLPYDHGAPLALVAGEQHHLDVLPTTSGKRLACVVIDPEEHV